MEMSADIGDLAKALAAAQGEITDLSKDQQGYGYKYADLAQTLRSLRPVLSKHGLAISQTAGSADDQVSVTTVLMHSSGQWLRDTLTMPVHMAKGLTHAQCVGMVLTYARRYSIQAIAGQASSDDTDGGGGKGEEELPITTSEAAGLNSDLLALGVDVSEFLAYINGKKKTSFSSLAEVPSGMLAFVRGVIELKRAKAKASNKKEGGV